MSTSGTIRDVQTWAASEIPTGSSDDPHPGLKTHSTFLPLFASLDRSRGVPFVNPKFHRSTSKEIPKADADRLRHSVQ